MRRSMWFYVLAGLVAAEGVLAAADWPQWRGPARDGVSAAIARRTAWPAALSPAWKASVGVGHSSPVVVGGRVFLLSWQADDEVLEAFDLSTGRRAWRPRWWGLAFHRRCDHRRRVAPPFAKIADVGIARRLIARGRRAGVSRPVADDEALQVSHRPVVGESERRTH